LAFFLGGCTHHSNPVRGHGGDDGIFHPCAVSVPRGCASSPKHRTAPCAAYRHGENPPNPPYKTHLERVSAC
jgi:hypothetical protein